MCTKNKSNKIKIITIDFTCFLQAIHLNILQPSIAWNLPATK